MIREQYMEFTTNSQLNIKKQINDYQQMSSYNIYGKTVDVLLKKLIKTQYNNISTIVL